MMSLPIPLNPRIFLQIIIPSSINHSTPWVCSIILERAKIGLTWFPVISSFLALDSHKEAGSLMLRIPFWDKRLRILAINQHFRNLATLNWRISLDHQMRVFWRLKIGVFKDKSSLPMLNSRLKCLSFLRKENAFRLFNYVFINFILTWKTYLVCNLPSKLWISVEIN